MRMKAQAKLSLALTCASRATSQPSARDVGSSVTLAAAITTGLGAMQLAPPSQPTCVSRMTLRKHVSDSRLRR